MATKFLVSNVLNSTHGYANYKTVSLPHTHVTRPAVSLYPSLFHTHTSSLALQHVCLQHLRLVAVYSNNGDSFHSIYIKADTGSITLPCFVSSKVPTVASNSIDHRGF